MYCVLFPMASTAREVQLLLLKMTIKNKKIKKSDSVECDRV